MSLYQEIDEPIGTTMAVSKKRKYIETEIPEWLERNKARYFVRSVEKLESVPDNGNKADLRMVAIQLENMQMGVFRGKYSQIPVYR